MGSLLSTPWGSMHTHVLILGLDNAGKTTLLQRLKEMNQHRALKEVAPTVGVSQDYVQLRDHAIRLSVFDLSGHGRYRGLWEHQMSEQVTGIIFVVDATDDMRFVVARDELDSVLKAPAAGARKAPMPVLFLANKMDGPGAASAVRCAQQMRLPEGLCNAEPWHICATNGLTGEGLRDGVDWLAQQLWNVRKQRK